MPLSTNQRHHHCISCQALSGHARRALQAVCYHLLRQPSMNSECRCSTCSIDSSAAGYYGNYVDRLPAVADESMPVNIIAASCPAPYLIDILIGAPNATSTSLLWMQCQQGHVTRIQCQDQQRHVLQHRNIFMQAQGAPAASFRRAGCPASWPWH